MASTIEHPDQDQITQQDHTDRGQVRRWRLIAALLAIVALGLGAVLAVIIVTGDDDGAGGAPDEVLQVLYDYERAFEEGDTELMASIIDADILGTTDMYLPGTTEADWTWGQTDDSLTDRVDRNVINDRVYWTAELSDDFLVAGDGPWVIASRETWTDPSNREEGVRIAVVVDDDGTPKLENFYYVAVQYPEIPDWGD